MVCSRDVVHLPNTTAVTNSAKYATVTTFDAGKHTASKFTDLPKKYFSFLLLNEVAFVSQYLLPSAYFFKRLNRIRKFCKMLRQ